MYDIDAIADAVRRAWAHFPAPPAEDLKLLKWSCGEEAWRSFVNVAPVEVDVSAPGFLGCTPLLDLPPAASAAYLGTYLLSLLEGLKFQDDHDLFYDILTRAHVIFCLSEPDYWQSVIRTHLPTECKAAVVAVVSYLAASHDRLPLPPEQIVRIVALSRGEQ